MKVVLLKQDGGRQRSQRGREFGILDNSLHIFNQALDKGDGKSSMNFQLLLSISK